MDKEKLIEEVMKDLVENHSDLIKESVNRLLKEEEESEEEFERRVLDVINNNIGAITLANTRIVCYSSKAWRTCLDYSKYYIDTVVNGLLIPSKDDICKSDTNIDIYNKIVKYPFRIVKMDKDSVTLLGLRPLDHTNWENCKDNKYKFVFNIGHTLHSNGDYKIIAEGHIPTKEEIESIPENLRAIGDWYWTSTSFDTSYAWIVRNNGNVSYDSVSTSFGVVPYIIIPL